MEAKHRVNQKYNQKVQIFWDAATVCENAMLPHGIKKLNEGKWSPSSVFHVIINAFPKFFEEDTTPTTKTLTDAFKGNPSNHCKQTAEDVNKSCFSPIIACYKQK